MDASEKNTELMTCSKATKIDDFFSKLGRWDVGFAFLLLFCIRVLFGVAPLASPS